MVWNIWNTETVGPGGDVGSVDWNSAGKLLYSWDDVALAASAITIPGDGKYRVTYSGAQNLATVNGISNGDVIILQADVTGAGGNLTVQHGVGNINLNAGLDAVLSDDTAYMLLIAIGSALYGGVWYAP